MTALHDELDTLLHFWFGELDDTTLLDPGSEPFATHYARWYGKQPSVDDDIRRRFEPLLTRLAATPATWQAATERVDADTRHNLALTLLIDQVPRNIYRGTARMYAFDHLGIDHARRNVDADDGLSLIERMFATVPLMHAEDLVIQTEMEERFEALARLAPERSPQNQPFFEMSLDFARRHRAVIERFGRFPHRNRLLGRTSTPEEAEALSTGSIAF